MKKELQELGTIANYADKIWADIGTSFRTIDQRGFQPETEIAKEIAGKINALIEGCFKEKDLISTLEEIRALREQTIKEYNKILRQGVGAILPEEDHEPVDLARKYNYPGA